VPHLRISQVADLLRVSDDTVRRWIDAGRITATHPPSGRAVISGEEVARFVREQRALSTPAGTSARNQFEGIVTDVKIDGLMAQVELQAGAFRVVSLISAEAATELGLAAGVLAVASVKSTNVVIDLPR